MTNLDYRSKVKGEWGIPMLWFVLTELSALKKNKAKTLVMMVSFTIV